MLQTKLFKHILSKYSQSKLAIIELGDILEISQSAVYKRLQGKKRITSDEISILMDRFNIDPTILFSTDNASINFDFHPLKESLTITGGYISLIKKELETLSLQSDGKITYASTDLPFFYYFLHKEIAWFKLYLFQHNASKKSISQLPKISFSAIGEKEEQLFNTIKVLYSRIDSEEIWTSRAFRITIDQIKYFIEMDLFQYPEEALLLMEKLVVAADQLLEMVNKNNKGLMINSVTKGGAFELNYNDFNRFNPLIISSSKNYEKLYLTYDLPNYLQTQDERFIEYTRKWLDRIKRKAFPLSANAEIEQVLFFNRIKKYIQDEKEMMKERFVKR